MNTTEITGKLRQNIINIFGEKGKSWLANLPVIVEELSFHWKLTDLIPVDNMTFNYVAKAISNHNQAVILKISYDAQSIEDEKNALNYFNGIGAIKLLDDNKKNNALLLQQAIPGVTLKTFYPEKETFVMDCYVSIVQKVHRDNIPAGSHFRHVHDWLKAIDNVNSDNMPIDLLQKAIHLKNKLLASSGKEVVLHGDLHHDNILKHGDQWLAIDPKGIIGEAEFEVAAFDFIHDSELADTKRVSELFTTRAACLANKANLNAKRLKEWVFVRLILSAAWSIEDNCDPSWAINLANLIDIDYQ